MGTTTKYNEQHKKAEVVMSLIKLANEWLVQLINDDNVELSLDKTPTFIDRDGKDVLASETFTVTVTYKEPIEI